MKAMNRIYGCLCVLALTLIMGACTERMDLDLEVMESTPVITGIISDQEQWVRLNTTSAYLSGNGTPISGADVTVSDGRNTFSLDESSSEKGLYLFSNKLLINPNAEYTLNVSADFDGSGVKQEYSAASKVARTPKLDSVTIQVLKSFDELFWFVQVNYQEVSEANSYLCRIYVNDMLDVGLSSYSMFDNRYAKGKYMEHKIVSVLHERPLSDEKVQVGDVILVCFSGITKEYYDFLSAAQEETEGGNPIFGGPPANVKGNISNGALGFFTVYQVSAQSVLIADQWVF